MSTDNLTNSNNKNGLPVVVNFATLMPNEPNTVRASTNNRNSYSTYIETGDVVIPIENNVSNKTNPTYARNTSSSSSLNTGKPPVNKAIRVEPSPSGVTRIYINQIRTNNHVIDKVKQVNEIARQFQRSGSKTSLSSLKDQQQQKAKEAIREQSASLSASQSIFNQPPPAPPLPQTTTSSTTTSTSLQQSQQVSQSMNNSSLNSNQCSSTPCSVKNSKRSDSSQRLNDLANDNLDNPVDSNNNKQSETNTRPERGLYVVNIDDVEDDDDDDEEDVEKPVPVSNSTQQSTSQSVKNISVIKGDDKKDHHLTLNSQETLNDEIEKGRIARTETFYDGCKVWTALTDAEQSDDEAELIPMEDLKSKKPMTSSQEDLTEGEAKSKDEEDLAVKVCGGKEKKLIKKKGKKSDKEVESKKKKVKISLPNEEMDVSASSANLIAISKNLHEKQTRQRPARNLQKCCLVLFLLLLIFIPTGILVYFFAWNIYNSQIQG